MEPFGGVLGVWVVGGGGVHRVKWIINVLVLKLVPAESTIFSFATFVPIFRVPLAGGCEAAGGVEHLYLTTHADDGIVLSSLFTLLVFGSLILNISGYQRLTTQVHVDLAKLALCPSSSDLAASWKIIHSHHSPHG